MLRANAIRQGTHAMTDDDRPLARRNSRATLDRMLGDIIDSPDRTAAISADIQAIFGETRAILILDMSGFTRSTQQRGIIAFLLRIHKMRRICTPAVAEAGGLIIKVEADNLYALFDDAPAALAAARDMLARLDAANSLAAEDAQLYAAIGIGYGSLLNIDDADVYGDEMNLACKLGEDIAEGGQILLTPAARARPGMESAPVREEAVNISGLTLPYFIVEHS